MARQRGARPLAAGMRPLAAAVLPRLHACDGSAAASDLASATWPAPCASLRAGAAASAAPRHCREQKAKRRGAVMSACRRLRGRGAAKRQALGRWVILSWSVGAPARERASRAARARLGSAARRRLSCCICCFITALCERAYRGCALACSLWPRGEAGQPRQHAGNKLTQPQGIVQPAHPQTRKTLA